MSTPPIIPIVLCIDAEPDEFEPNPSRADPWRGFEASAGLAVDLRRRLSEATGRAAALSWFVRADPLVARIYGAPKWAFDAYRGIIDAARSAGDEVGLHVHLARWNEARSCWIEDFADGAWIEHCAEVSFASFGEALGVPCHSVRIGCHFMSEELSAALARLGARFDLTLEPGALERSRLWGRETAGALPDLTDLPRHPYRRSTASFRRPGDSAGEGMWMLPVTTAPIDADAPEAARQASDDGAYVRLGLWYAPEVFRYVAGRALRDPAAPCLVMVLRSDMPLVPGLAAAIDANVEWVCRHPLAGRFEVSTPAAAVDTLCPQRIPSSRTSSAAWR